MWEYLEVSFPESGTWKTSSGETGELVFVRHGAREDFGYLSHQELLDELGAKGWELVQQFKVDGGHRMHLCLLFKRPGLVTADS